ncbi:MAG TPA: DegT/DnrJ/EryC1/StrS family aminotransferase [Terracidiphilus sp.]|jgi:dTDP-4-amino-4,6-dideoxygalactose transaminase
MSTNNCIANDVHLGKDVKLSTFINLYGCSIGDGTKLGAFVEVQKNASVGSNCKISSHSFICEGVTIEDNVFIGHGVMFTNDRYPRATASDGSPQTDADWAVEPTLVKKGASIGSGATILPNITIGEDAIIGAGTVVTRNVPAHAVVAGNPGKVLRFVETAQEIDPLAAIPFVDLVTPHVEFEQELVSTFRTALRSASFVGGPAVEEFEAAFASFCSTEYAVGVNSGTDALRFAMIACGVQPGDVVLTVPNTFIATTEAISQAGAFPEFIDIDKQTYNLSVKLLQQFLESQCTRDGVGRLVSLRSGRPVTAVVPVHLFGQMADMDAILALAEQYQLTVIEDACQAHGAEYFSRKLNRWMKAGSMGRAAAFSFYPGKNLGACGEGGAVTTSDRGVATRIKALRDHGSVKKYCHDEEGYNGRLDAIQAGLLMRKLPHLAAWNAARRERAAEYNCLFAASEAIVVPYEPNYSRAVFHLYVIRVDHRDALISYLKEGGIGTGIHYPIPLHLQRAYSLLDYGPGSFPVAEEAALQIVSLPMFPHLPTAQQRRVAGEIQAFTSTASAHAPVDEEVCLETASH